MLKKIKEIRPHVSEALRGKIGPDARRWKGEEAGYVAKHMWIIKYYGKAHKCENPDCKSRNAKRFEWANISGNYLRDVSDYKMMCPSCHRKMDRGNYCKRGHEFTSENTYLRKEGWRACRTCMSEHNRKYLKRIKDAKTNKV